MKLAELEFLGFILINQIGRKLEDMIKSKLSMYL